jgi:hypothetical protein
VFLAFKKMKKNFVPAWITDPPDGNKEVRPQIILL